jgi:Prokaryotic E2 family E
VVALDEIRTHADELATLAGVRVDVERDGAQVYVLLRALPLPRGVYQVATTDVLFITDAQYPLSAMDMFWTDPSVLRPDGSVPIGGDNIEIHLGRPWRRFSWHRNGVWNPARNGLLDHFEFMQARFAQDVAA